MPSNENEPANLRALIREARRQWEINHPEEVEEARLKSENLRLEAELRAGKAREAEHIAQRRSSQRLAIMISVYVAGWFLIWLLFGGACPSCAYNGASNATGVDFIVMVVWLGWGVGGLFAGGAIAEKFLIRGGNGS